MLPGLRVCCRSLKMSVAASSGMSVFAM